MARKFPRSFDRFRGASRPVHPGEAPGTLQTAPDATRTTIRFFGFSPETGDENVEERSVTAPEEIPELRKKWPASWVHVSGLGDLDTLSKLGEIFQLHRLALEDVLNSSQRPKIEEFDDILFLVARYNSWRDRLHSEQISLFLGENFVLSFQESENDAFDGARQRLRKGKGRIRSSADYLAYALLDSIVDHNFPLLETYGDRLEALEEESLNSWDEDTMAQIYKVKRDLAAIRRTVWPLRDVFQPLLRGDVDYFKEDTLPFLRDCSDHVLQVIDLIEHYREIATELVNVYMSGLSNRMNDVMRLLTLIATIFIPLGFIAGLYGMNFDAKTSPWNMPELSWRFGYPLVLGLMSAMALGMVLYFRKKGWLGKPNHKHKSVEDRLNR